MVCACGGQQDMKLDKGLHLLPSSVKPQPWEASSVSSSSSSSIGGGGGGAPMMPHPVTPGQQHQYQQQLGLFEDFKRYLREDKGLLKG